MLQEELETIIPLEWKSELINLEEFIMEKDKSSHFLLFISPHENTVMTSIKN